MSMHSVLKRIVLGGTTRKWQCRRLGSYLQRYRPCSRRLDPSRSGCSRLYISFAAHHLVVVPVQLLVVVFAGNVTHWHRLALFCEFLVGQRAQVT